MSFGETIRNSILKLLFELIGTGFLSLLFNTSGGFGSQQASLLLGLWVLIIFGMKISGSHYNPAISFAFMFRKDIGNFPRPLGIAYIIFQIIGAFCGSLLAWFYLTDRWRSAIYIVDPKFTF